MEGHQPKAAPRRRLSDSQLALEVERIGSLCPLLPGEITEWSGKLGGAGTDGERRLQNLVTYWFSQASSFSRVWQAADAAREREYVNFRLEQGDPADAITLPPHFHRIDKWLPEISNRLAAIHIELLGLPGAVGDALRVRFGDYEEALDHLATLPAMLNTMADAWHRPGPGQPSVETESWALELLTYAIEDYTGREFPSPRSYKRLAEIELVRRLAARLFPSYSSAKINTMLRHFHERRLGGARDGSHIRQRSQL